MRTVFCPTSSLASPALLFFGLLGAVTAPVFAQCTEDHELVAAGLAQGDHFGFATAIDADVLVVGAHRDDDAGADAGAARVFRRQPNGTWKEEQKLLASDARPYDWFGHAVAISGNVIVIGARYSDAAGTLSGSAYVFRHDGTSWVQEAKLVPAGLNPEDELGSSVDVDGEVIVLGAMGDDQRGSNAGAAYVYWHHASGWSQDQKLVPAGAAAGDRFGSWVQVDAGWIAGGSPEADGPGGIDQGSVTLFERDVTTGVWHESQTLFATDGAAFDRFGFSAALELPLLVVGAPNADEGGVPDMGAAYVFRLDGSLWGEEQKLQSPSGSHGDEFGNRVGVSGNVVVIGAWQDEAVASDGGAAYVFRHHDKVGGHCGWVFDLQLVESRPLVGETFGRGVAVSGTVALIGAALDASTWVNAGAAFIYDVAELSLAIDPVAVSPGQTLTFTSCCGAAGERIALAVTRIDGVSTLMLLLYGSFGLDCRFRLSTVVGPELSGHRLTFETFEQIECPEKIASSNPVEVTFL